MTGSHAVGDYVVFAVVSEGHRVHLRGYIQKAIGDPVAYIVRVGVKDFEVSEQEIVNG
jgi:hypothetical protein